MTTPSSSKATPYFSNGRALESPPFSVRFHRALEAIYTFLGLYVISLFSLDPYTAAQTSRFNIHNLRASSAAPREGGGLGGWGGGSDSFGGAGSGRKIGRVDDVRAPECGSCQ